MNYLLRLRTEIGLSEADGAPGRGATPGRRSDEQDDTARQKAPDWHLYLVAADRARLPEQQVTLTEVIARFVEGVGEAHEGAAFQVVSADELAAAIDRAPPPTFVVTNADLKMVGSTDSQPIGACHRVRTGKSS